VGIPQSNAFELFKFILEALHEELNRVKYKPPTRKVEISRKISGNLHAIVNISAITYYIV
jgi:hypothetical protein